LQFQNSQNQQQGQPSNQLLFMAKALSQPQLLEEKAQLEEKKSFFFLLEHFYFISFSVF
jgi:hypothetical protein